tara:strand:+ start:188 stop:1741 length:1554 start_codon:yes stop_codon:yes gene_type:complete
MNIIFFDILMPDNPENLFLPEWFPANFSEDEKSLMWRWESGHNIMPITPLSSDISAISTSKGIDDANSYFGLETKSQKKIINGYTYFASNSQPNDNKKLNHSYCENLDYKWKNDFLPKIINDLELMKQKLESIHDWELSKNIINEMLELNKNHWYIHMLIVIPLHQYTEEFFNYLKTFRPDLELTDLYNLFKGIKNKTIEIDQNLYNLKIKYDSKYSLDKNELLSEIESFNKSYGYRLVGFDLSDEIWINDPQIVFNLIKNLPINVFKKKVSNVDDTEKVIDLDTIISDLESENEKNQIKSMYSVLHKIWYLKEDHSFYIDQYSNALISLAFRKMGDILVDKNLLKNNQDIFHLNFKLIMNMDIKNINLQEIVNNSKNNRDYYKNLTPPKYLGKLNDQVESMNDQIFFESTKQLKGTSASAGKISGLAKIIRSFEDWDKLQEGDIMVCISTNPSWTPLFGMVSGIISENGGTLSHTAIVAREYEIPTILDVNNATVIINDNDLIEIDGDTGIVTFIN